MSLFKKAKPIDAMKHFALFLLALILFWEGKFYWGIEIFTFKYLTNSVFTTQSKETKKIKLRKFALVTKIAFLYA
jgi:hypothetical protein